MTGAPIASAGIGVLGGTSRVSSNRGLGCPPTVASVNAAGRERLWQAVNVVAKVRDHIVKVVNDGKLSQRHLDELTRRTRRRP